MLGIRIAAGNRLTTVFNASIADHMYRMAVLALCCTDETLDIPKYVHQLVACWSDGNSRGKMRDVGGGTRPR